MNEISNRPNDVVERWEQANGEDFDFCVSFFFTFIFCVCSRLVAHLHKHTQHSNMDMEQNSR